MKLRHNKYMKDHSNVATDMNYSVASFLSLYKAICNPKMGITRFRGPPQRLTIICIM